MGLKLFAALSLLVGVLLCVFLGGFESLMWLWLLPLGAVGALLVLAALVFLFLLIACALIDPDKEQQDDSKFFRVLVNLIVETLFPFARVKINTQGLEKTPKDGRFLLVCNHIHDIDPAVLFKCFPKSQLAFVGKQEVRDMFLVGKIMPKLLCQFINRENDKEALKTILKCISLLKGDKVSIAVFPEGYIRPNRKLHHFRPGVFKIAQKAKVPIVVCTLQGSQYVMKNFLKLKPSTVDLHLLDVISTEALQGRTTVEIAQQVYTMMAQDLGPENVHQETEDNT